MGKRALTFEFIADERFSKNWGNNGLDYLNDLDMELKNKLSYYPTLELVEKSIRTLDWDMRGAEVQHRQYRKTYIIVKTGRKITWDDVMGIVNSVKAVPYDFVKV